MISVLFSLFTCAFFVVCVTFVRWWRCVCVDIAVGQRVVVLVCLVFRRIRNWSRNGRVLWGGLVCGQMAPRSTPESVRNILRTDSLKTGLPLWHQWVWMFDTSGYWKLGPCPPSPWSPHHRLLKQKTQCREKRGEPQAPSKSELESGWVFDLCSTHNVFPGSGYPIILQDKLNSSLGTSRSTNPKWWIVALLINMYILYMRPYASEHSLIGQLGSVPNPLYFSIYYGWILGLWPRPRKLKYSY